VVLGRIAANQFLGGAMAIDEARAAEAVARVAEPLGLPLVDAAAGILRVANANMERAIRAVSIERGHDPRDFALVAFGGAGGLHACELAAELGMRAVIVPRYAEALSALGMLLADCVRDYSAAALGREDFEERYRVLEAQAREELGERAELQRAADLRYAGQSYELTVTWRSRAKAVEEFHREHQRSYGYSSLARAVEVVTLRLRARIATKQPAITPLDADSKPPQTRRVFVEQRWRDIPVYTRAQLAGMKPTPGPAIVIDYGATTLAPPGWILRVDRVGNLICRME
jgi:N-methylhydantoinase A